MLYSPLGCIWVFEYFLGSEQGQRTVALHATVDANLSLTSHRRVRKNGEISHGQLCFIPKFDSDNWMGFDLSNARFRYRVVAVGGTFDILHISHEKLLAKAFEIGEFVFVGLTGDRLVSKLNKDHSVRTFTVRRRNLQQLLKARGWLNRARITELKDSFGPAIRRRRLEAIVVSEETRANGLRVNALRRSRGLKPLQLYVVRMVRADDGNVISDTRIRRGEVNPRGRLRARVGARIR